MFIREKQCKRRLINRLVIDLIKVHYNLIKKILIKHLKHTTLNNKIQKALILALIFWLVILFETEAVPFLK